MTDFNFAAFENALIADMRAHGGVVTSGPMAGVPLLVLRTTGARTGESRRSILIYTRDGDAFVVAGSNSGAPTVPAWVHNLEVEPEVTVEVGGRTFRALASITADDDRAALWNRHVAAQSRFGEYQEKAGRLIPMIRLAEIVTA